MKIDTIKSGGQSQGGLDNAGGTLSGPLKLSRDPQVPMEAATKRYVDTTLSNLSASNVVSGTLPIARLPAFSGDVTSEAGGNNVVLSNTGITVGEYGKIVVDAKGRATNGTGLGNSDIPNFDFSKIATDKPTTLVGYGITDGMSLAGGTMTGPLVLSGSPVSGDNLVPKQYIDGMVNTLSASKTGDVIRKAYATTPTGFLKCNGAEVSKTVYADLYAVIGESNSSYSVIGSGKPWQQQYQFNTSQSIDTAPWTTNSSVLPTGLSASQAIVTKNRVYVIGGYNGSAVISTVYTAPINTDGTLGAWTTATSLPGPIARSQAIVTKNRVYVIGGFNTAYVSTVYTASINSDGTLGAWTTATSLPAAFGRTQAIITTNRIYLLGGVNDITSFSTIYTAPINSDGTIGIWTIDSTSLPDSMSHSTAVVTKNRVYLLGGVNGTVYLNNVYTAPINADGTLGAWTTGTSLPVSLCLTQAVVTKNRVYLLGGFTGTEYNSTVFTTIINSDGTLGTWSTGTPLSSSFSQSSVITTKDHIYLLGGYSGTAHVSTIYSTTFSGSLNDYSAYYEDTVTNYMTPGSGKPWQQQYQINSSQTGDITGWTLNSVSQPSGFLASQPVITKNRIYLIGGQTGTTYLSTIYTAPINADGTIGAWITTTPLPVAQSGYIIVGKNRVYIIGGYNGSIYVKTIYSAPINADGTLGTWTLSSSTLPISVSSNCIITKNYVYIIGGYNGSAHINNVYMAPISEDGTIGVWTAGVNFPIPISSFEYIVTKNRVYICGGNDNSGNQLSTTYTASISSDGVIGPWSTGPSLPGTLSRFGVFVSKNRAYLIGGFNGASYTSVVYSAPILVDGTLGTFVTSTALPISYSYARVVCVKNKIYVMSGASNGAYTTNIYTAIVSEGLNDYSAYYDGTIVPFEPVNPTTTFKLPDMSATDVNGIYHYIKY